MRIYRLSLLVLVTASTFGAGPATRPVADDPNPNDPHVGLERFYDAVRKGDEAAAVDCWDVDSPGKEGEHVEELVKHYVRELIASSHLAAAVAAKLPGEYKKMAEAGEVTIPSAAQVKGATFTTFHGRALIRWGKDDDDALPMVYTRYVDQPRQWKVAGVAWHEATRSSVGDSMLISGVIAQAKEQTTKEILAGLHKGLAEVQWSMQRHVRENVTALPEK
jgi:hypothetical protein